MEGKRHGTGKMEYSTGNIYQGQWEQGIKHGDGKMIWKNRNEEYDGNIYLIPRLMEKWKTKWTGSIYLANACNSLSSISSHQYIQGLFLGWKATRPWRISICKWSKVLWGMVCKFKGT